jgi:alpha-galactosidase
VIKRYEERQNTWRDDARKWLSSDTPISLERGHEYAAYIINALQGGEPFEFNGNVRNTGLITNLPQDACVEVPVWVSKKGLEPVQVGALPPSVAMLTGLTSQIEELAVEGALTGNPRLVFQAIAHDPLTASVLTLSEIKQMVNEMFNKNRGNLPTFKHFEVA